MKKLSSKEIHIICANYKYDISRLSKYKENIIRFYIDKFKSNISSFIFSILYNEKEDIPKVLEFLKSFYFRKDIFDNFIIYRKENNNPEWFVVNNNMFNYDLDKVNMLFAYDIDFPLVYFRDEIYSITYEKDKIPENYIEDKQITIDENKYYLTPFIPIREIENNKIINNKIRGKDWLKHYIYKDVDVDGILYFLKIKQNNKIFYKVGISKNSVNERFNTTKNIEILEYFEYKNNMLICSIIEKYIHENFSHLREFNIIEEFGGKTECYIKNMIYLLDSNIIVKSLQYLDEINYPLSSNIIKLILQERNIKI